MTWQAGSRPAARPDIEPTLVDDELVLWDPRFHRVHRLDPVGSLLWPFLDGEATVAELAADVAEVWGTTEAEATESLLRLLDQLDTAFLLIGTGTGLGQVVEVRPPERTIANPQRCGTNLSRWTWERPITVEVGDQHLAFRVNDPELHGELGLVMADHVVDEEVSVNYSLKVPDRESTLSLLFWGRCTVDRRRTAADGLVGLLAHLVGHGPVPTGAVRIDGHLLAAGDRGVVFPATERNLLWPVAARLRSAGVTVVPAAWVDVDVRDGRVVRPSTELHLDAEALGTVLGGRPVAGPVDHRAVAMWVPGWMAIDSPAALASGFIHQDLLADPSSALPHFGELTGTLELLHRPDGARPQEVAALVARCLEVPFGP